MTITRMDDSTEPRIEIRETFMRPTTGWPEGGYLREVGGQVEIATGYYAALYPDKPSPYLGGKPPVAIMWNDWSYPWPKNPRDAPRDTAGALRTDE